jgi:polysaccharide biosynthesis/export protein
MVISRILAGLLAALALASCASSESFGDVAYAPQFTAPEFFVPGAATTREYRIGPLDKLSVQVFQVEELSVDEVQVDASGRMMLPQVGGLTAAGKTIPELTSEIATALKACCLHEPNVTVLVTESLSQQITVTGAVIESGVFPLQGRTTLLQAVALAKGPDQRAANLNQVAVFRVINGRREAAMFDLAAIRAGRSDDPEVIGGDVVVVDFSGRKTLLRDLAGGAPLFGMFRPF